MKTPLYIVDAFADRPFSGNPAAVCLLNDDADADWMQAVASEMNLSETAFLQSAKDGYQLRWFTPTYEVDLCGHATLASAHVLWAKGLIPETTSIRFHTHSGVLTCENTSDVITLDFPVTAPEHTETPSGLLEALEIKSAEFVGKSPFDAIVVVDSEATVLSLQPDFAAMADIPMRGVIVTAKSDNPAYDFVSRFFAPAAGVNEDPVTGSAHCCLAPFWQDRLGKSQMTAYQASKRGGIVRVDVRGERVLLSGKAITVMEGELRV